MTLTSDGDELAPELVVCEGPDECAVCHKKDTCDDFESPDDEDEDTSSQRNYMARILDSL